MFNIYHNNDTAEFRSQESGVRSQESGVKLANVYRFQFRFCTSLICNLL
ncbi:hypothetical protein [Trichormus sp. NMC-1]|nr:hypothetical protein [Trichormus sp. NMC-1]